MIRVRTSSQVIDLNMFAELLTAGTAILDRCKPNPAGRRVLLEANADSLQEIAVY
jgi:hypothetical protein